MSNSHEIYTWGPPLFKGSLPNNVVSELRERVIKANSPANEMLASDIDDVKFLTEEDKDWVSVSMSDVLRTYVTHLLDAKKPPSLSVRLKPFSQILLQSAWVNRQLPNEFNPPHSHGGDISFVIYLTIPPELKKEQAEYKGNLLGPGSISFKYGEVGDFFVHRMEFFPEEGDVLMFPSMLYHWVTPFRSNCTRVSVAGNFVAF